MMLKTLASLVCVSLLSQADLGGCAGTDAEPAGAARLDTYAAAVLDADYRGDRASLARLAQAPPGDLDRSLEADGSYWKGFAWWRRAINGFNETPMPTDLRADLEQATRGFRAALAARPGWLEAKIGLVGCQANLLFVSGSDTAATRGILAEFVPVFREIVAQGADNPRAQWLIGGSQLGAPPPYGGDAAKAAATYRRGLEAGRREARGGGMDAPARVPTWGTPENLMSLAYLHTHTALKDPGLARAYAEGALAAVPQWHYVGDILLPQIVALEQAPTAGE